jgi:hypothetical protein
MSIARTDYHLVLWRKLLPFTANRKWLFDSPRDMERGSRQREQIYWNGKQRQACLLTFFSFIFHWSWKIVQPSLAFRVEFFEGPHSSETREKTIFKYVNNVTSIFQVGYLIGDSLRTDSTSLTEVTKSMFPSGIQNAPFRPPILLTLHKRLWSGEKRTKIYTQGRSGEPVTWVCQRSENFQWSLTITAAKWSSGSQTSSSHHHSGLPPIFLSRLSSHNRNTIWWSS